MPKYLRDPVNLRVEEFRDRRATPLPSRATFERDFIGASGNPSEDKQEELSKQMGFKLSTEEASESLYMPW